MTFLGLFTLKSFGCVSMASQSLGVKRDTEAMKEALQNEALSSFDRLGRLVCNSRVFTLSYVISLRLRISLG